MSHNIHYLDGKYNCGQCHGLINVDCKCADTVTDHIVFNGPECLHDYQPDPRAKSIEAETCTKCKVLRCRW